MDNDYQELILQLIEGAMNRQGREQVPLQSTARRWQNVAQNVVQGILPVPSVVDPSNNNSASTRATDASSSEQDNSNSRDPLNNNRIETPPPPRLNTLLENHCIEMLSDLVYAYNNNIRDYQYNIRNIVHLSQASDYNNNIRDYQSNIHDIIQLFGPLENIHVDTGSSSPLPQTTPVSRSVPLPSTYSLPRTAPLSSTYSLPRTAPLSRSAPLHQSIPLQNDTDTSILLSYFYYPLSNTTNPINAPVQSTNVVPLTREEIARTTRTYGYTENMVLSDSSANVCPISLDPFTVGDVICEIRGCSHIFKRPPLMNWLTRNSRCPICRYELRDYVEPQAEDDQEDDEEEQEPEDAPSNSPSVNIQNLLQSDFINSLMNSQNRTSTFDGSGNEIYEFDIPINDLFQSLFQSITNTVEQPENDEMMPDISID